MGRCRFVLVSVVAVLVSLAGPRTGPSPRRAPDTDDSTLVGGQPIAKP